MSHAPPATVAESCPDEESAATALSCADASLPPPLLEPLPDPLPLEPPLLLLLLPLPPLEPPLLPPLLPPLDEPPPASSVAAPESSPDVSALSVVASPPFAHAIARTAATAQPLAR